MNDTEKKIIIWLEKNTSLAFYVSISLLYIYFNPFLEEEELLFIMWYER